MPSAKELSERGIYHAQRGEFRQAAEFFLQAAAAEPSAVHSHINLGNVLAELGEYPAAKASYQRALRLAPTSVDLYLNYGVMLTRMEDHQGAAASYRRATELAPHQAAGYSRLGTSLARLERQAEAVAALRRAAQLAPLDFEIHSNLATALLQNGEYAEGLASYEASLRLKPNAAETLCNYAIALMEAGREEESLAQFDAALALKPDYHDARLSRAVALLLRGDYARGWPAYEERIKNKSLVRVTHQKPLWDGSPLAGRTLLLEAEQGMGDTIQFVRYAKEVKNRHQGQIVVAVEPALVPLLTGIQGADQLIAQKDPRPEFDVWAPLMSLPGIMKNDASSFPSDVPYLRAEPARVEKWQQRLVSVQGLKVGIAWQGSKLNKSDRRRSFPLAELARLGKLPGVTLISLQKGEGADQLQGLTEFQVLTLGEDFDGAGGAFLDTAAVMKNLDLVVTADTSICHLAGALGVRVWLALAYVPDWRWTLQGETTPWYPTMRLFRQLSLGDWPGVFQQMAHEIKIL